ncbi:AraC family transcriptional regulator [Actinomadura sp. HBU206391]|uniref:AraC family transcriptional regulator n=1 Tax=Actinomadura sp. HBU206391 TaxID=2731692 RepID=UPI00164FB6D2|nr:AraC family transcriptional regulator [Actinomadura sp. HBU206391]MBC6461426.1 AraC family transcriptional regulator [Actinomadura sp. HBU206391]
MDVDGEWVSYWRSADQPLEAMRAHFQRHAYHRHSHETYSFGVTEQGAQSFRCRGAAHTSTTGMVMAFNPDDPHDGRTATDPGFTYRIVHVGAELVADVLGDVAGRPAGLPLFADPIVHDRALARVVWRLHTELTEAPADGAGALRRDELLSAALTALVRRGATGPGSGNGTAARNGASAVRIAGRVRTLLDEAYADDLGADDLAAVTGASRYAVYRAFQAVYGMSPSDYQRQARLRAARRMLATGGAPARVAAAVGFADQSHLTRWFSRYYGITPGAYRHAALDHVRPSCPMGDRESDILLNGSEQ